MRSTPLKNDLLVDLLKGVEVGRDVQEVHDASEVGLPVQPVFVRAVELFGSGQTFEVDHRSRRSRRHPRRRSRRRGPCRGRLRLDHGHQSTE
eukprot:15425233-Heterocapsa_arctica.AAC.1